MSHISEGNSVDSDDSAEDVEMLLAPVASVGAPTPAMPRVQLTRQRLPPQTPTRANLLPTRANMSYLSPLPPGQGSPSSLRPPRPAGSDRGRGSILSWEQLATESSVKLEECEIESMLTDIDIPTPFRSGTVTPSPTAAHLDFPDSPMMNAMPSPGGFGSISQVLLPDVTPSPAVHYHQLERYDNISSDGPAVDAAVVTLLRLQLASAEHIAKERLAQLQAMEHEIHAVRDKRQREAEELVGQVSYLEDQLRGAIEVREKNDEERAAYAASLEDQLRHDQAYRDQAIGAAVAKANAHAQAVRMAAVERERQRCAVACSARAAAAGWCSVRDAAESELDLVRASKEVLAVLLAGLGQSQQELSQGGH
jgi:hypothetical protein